MDTNDLKKVLAGCCLAALLASASAGVVNAVASGSG
ncbi:MAG: selenobiotic family radical SAM modification target peptide [Proteobacteria bacterium]|jgi:radical SAM modification target selenobiotic family peptide|uniref:Radical SAM modification target peptide, selenobiotic family n=2 Tax=Desulfomicrobium norvegicum (strain DSM 1741 / NCIMB 8310) TaxID=52561 RepID=A0A8G2F905_DESNO|nr:selenobiotic family radical SAM modification target peptide [Pseudomonadota bacterium]SFM19699.1 radical SAM modification target peptide, selenobiotic family [Desulfomicrobium norvegicum]